jgi:uncharacterized membrane protein YjfL (UPF0719 family)
MSRLTRLRNAITVVEYFAFWGVVAIAIQLTAIRYYRMQNAAESITNNK